MVSNLPTLIFTPIIKLETKRKKKKLLFISALLFHDDIPHRRQYLVHRLVDLLLHGRLCIIFGKHILIHNYLIRSRGGRHIGRVRAISIAAATTTTATAASINAYLRRRRAQTHLIYKSRDFFHKKIVILALRFCFVLFF